MSNEKLSSELNEQQYKAVNCSLGNKLILAGAGSGKTKVLIHRVAVLIRDFNIKPSNILALTFTNKASNEMKQRLENILRSTSQGLWFGTFHGICRRILKIHWKAPEEILRFFNFQTFVDCRTCWSKLRRMISRQKKSVRNY